MMRCLLVRPAVSPDANGGDTVVYRRLEAHLAQRADLDVLELARAPRATQLLNVAAGLPPEAARYATRANAAALAERLERRPVDVVLFAHEAAFPLAAAPLPAGTRKILYPHNVQSLIAATDRSLAGRLLQRNAARFDRRWSSDAAAEIVCISRVDVEALREIGVVRDDVEVAPPGAPPAAPLPPGAAVIPELVLTGSYGWWRKRRDLRRFAAEPAVPYPILANDPIALEALAGQARAAAGVDWSAGLRFALITDRFQGGFKLKSVEYVALNGLLLSFCDLSAEFAGLPHAEEFVRCVDSKAQVAQVVREVCAQPAEPVLARFRAFKAACLQRYEWDRCLEPIGRRLAGPAAALLAG